MKVSSLESRRRGRAHGFLAPFHSPLQLLGLCLAACLSVGLLGAADGRPPEHGGFVDEMVGTLPSFGGDDDPEDAPEFPHAGAAFFIEGPWLLVAQFAAGAQADWIHYEQTDTGELRALFHGDLRMDLPGNAFQGGALHAGLRLEFAGGHSQVALFLGGQLVSLGVQESAQDLPLPMQRLQDAGVLASRGGVKVLTQNLEPGRSTLSLSESPGNLHVTHSH